MGFHEIAVTHGDLNGGTVTDAFLTVLNAMGSHLDYEVRTTNHNYNTDYFLENNITELGKKELDILKKYDAIYLGAIGEPTKMTAGVIEVGYLLKIRQEFEQTVNLRPVILPEGVPSRIVGKNHRHINMEICRQNSEGLYVNEGTIENEGTDDEVATQVMRCSYKAIKSLMEFAKERAIARNRQKKVTMVFKNNVLKHASIPWNRVFEEYKSDTQIDIDYMHIDAFVMAMIEKPEVFDVVITENMFGDIATDLGAVLQGGIGSAISGNLNLNGKFPSMYEPVHGTAPDLWYRKDENGLYIPNSFTPDLITRVKPEAALLSGAMMLEHLGETKAANVLKEAALKNIRDPEYKNKTLDQLTQQVIDYLRN